MGYTHYWRRPRELDAVAFKAFAEDCARIFNYSENGLGIHLASGQGKEGTVPYANENDVCFNGSEVQPIGIWTSEEEGISIPWPDDNAGVHRMNADPIAEKVSGRWHSGALLTQRTAPIGKNGKGSGDYETFYISRVFEHEAWEEEKSSGLHFSCTKTAYRPYDLTVTAVLVAFKHHFPAVRITSDGELKDWADGILLCSKLFDYGHDFQLGEYKSRE